MTDPGAASAPQRIAYITTGFPWRSETAVIKEMFELAEQGFHISVVSLKKASFEGTFDPKAFRFQDRTYYPGPGVWLRSALRAAGHLVTRPRFRRLLGTTLRRSNGHLAKNLYILLLLVPDLARRLRALGIGYVHANFASFQAFAALGVHELTGIPFGFTVHAHDIFLHDFMIPEKVSSAALVVSISRYNIDYMRREFGVGTEACKVIHCGVDLDEFTPGTEPAGEVPMIFSVGRLDPMKGFDVLLEACRILRGQVPFRCLVVGEGVEGERLRALVERHDLGSVVTLQPRAPQGQLVDLYRGCRLYAQPCRRTETGMQDGIPATLMEAMAVGKPVVSTRVSGIPELIDDAVNGILIESEDAEALAAAMRGLLEDPERSRRMGRAAREKIEKEFDIDRNARLLSDEIRRVLAAGGRGV